MARTVVRPLDGNCGTRDERLVDPIPARSQPSKLADSVEWRVTPTPRCPFPNDLGCDWSVSSREKAT